MPRNYKSTAVLQKPDPKFGSMLASKIINKLMQDGKKTTAQRIFYDALDMATKKLPDAEDQVEIFTRAIDNVRPAVEVRSKRVGGANYQVPIPVRGNRREALTFRWIIDAARKKKGRPMAQKLAAELMAAAENEGDAVKKKMDVHRMAEANRAFAHFRW